MRFDVNKMFMYVEFSRVSEMKEMLFFLLSARRSSTQCCFSKRGVFTWSPLP